MTNEQKKILKALVSTASEALRTEKVIKTIDLDEALHGDVISAKVELVVSTCEAALDAFDVEYEVAEVKEEPAQ